MDLKMTPTIIATAALLSCAVASARRQPAILLANGAAEASPVAVQQRPTAADLQKLELVLAIQDQSLKAEEEARALLAIRAAGVSVDRSTLPALWNLADRLSEGRAQLVALEALDALWRLGEPASEFEARLELLHAKPNLARFACLVLARSLRPEHVARIEAVAKAAEDAKLPHAHLFRNVVWSADLAATVAETYERASSLQARVDAVALQSIGNCRPFLSAKCTGFIESSLTTADPVKFVARARLYELSAAEPVATVTALMASAMGGVLTPELEPDEAKRQSRLDFWRDHAARHLAPAAKAIYLSRRPQAFDR